MSNKQIEEMARKICPCVYDYNDCKSCDLYEHESCLPFNIARELTGNNYCKASELIREIFEEIEKDIELAIESNYRAKKEHYNHSVIPNYDNFNAMCDGKIYAMRGLLDFIAELKKKYTEGEG